MYSYFWCVRGFRNALISFRNFSMACSSSTFSSSFGRPRSSRLLCLASNSSRLRLCASSASAGVPPAASLRRLPSSRHSIRYRPSPFPHFIRPRLSRSRATLFQPDSLLTWRVRLTRGIVSTSGRTDTILDTKQWNVKLSD